MAKPASSIFQNLKRYFKKPWEITGPCTDPEYKSALAGALEYRIFCLATAKEKACVPTSDPETVYDIKYFSRDQRRNRPPIYRTILKKTEVGSTVHTQMPVFLCAFAWKHGHGPMRFALLILSLSAAPSTLSL